MTYQRWCAKRRQWSNRGQLNRKTLGNPSVYQSWVARDTARQGYRFCALVLGIIKSPPFQMNVKSLQDAGVVSDASTRSNP